MKNLFTIILLLSTGYSQNNIECWGSDQHGFISDAPEGIFISIDGEQNHTPARFCAINESGAIECWGGHESWWAFDFPEGVFTDISVGHRFICAINESGGIECTCSYGGDWLGQCTDAPTGTGYIKIDSGSNFTCALDESGCIDCWGSDFESWAGCNSQGGTRSHYQVTNAPEECIFTDISTGKEHACATTVTGDIECWGQGVDCNHLGTNNTPPESLDGFYTDITSAVYKVNCAIDQLGQIECWGNHNFTNAPGGASWVSVVGSHEFTMAIDESGGVQVWGYSGGLVGNNYSDVFFDVAGQQYTVCGLTCAEALELDCAGECGGDAVKDDCGICNGDNSYCSDCAGVINGDAVVDCCDECNGDNSSCGGSGDTTSDGNIDISDIVIMIDVILLNSSLTECALNDADMNSDSNLNIMDVLAVVEIIMGEGLMRTNVPVPTSVELIQGANYLYYNADVEGIVGFELTLSHDDNIEFILTDKSIVSDYQTSGNTTKMIIVTEVGNELFSSTGDFEIIDVIAGSAQSEIEYSISITPKEFGLSQAYPNPFNPVTNINFTVKENQDIILQVYNLQGQTIETLVNGNMEAGYHTLQWNADNYSSGIYFVHMIAGEYIDTQKLMLMK